MTVAPHDAPWGMPPSLAPKSVVDLFYDAALHGQASLSIPPAEGAALQAALQSFGIQAPGDLSKAPVTAYQLFLPAFEEYAQFYNYSQAPETQTNLARLSRDYQADKASGQFTDEYYNANSLVQSMAQSGRGDGSKAWNKDLTLWGGTSTICDILIVNALDAPLTCVETCVGHGYPIYFPQVMTPIDHGDPLEASNNVIPGRTCMPDGTNRFGLGLYRFQKGDGAPHGTEGALKFSTPDPAAPQAIGIAWGLDYNNTPSMAATADLSQYNSLQAFYEATTGKSASTYGEAKFGVNINCLYFYADLNPPCKDDGHRVIAVVIQPAGGVKETNAQTAPAAAKALPAILKNIAAALPKPTAQPAPQPAGAVNKPGPGNANRLPPGVVPFVNDDN